MKWHLILLIILLPTVMADEGEIEVYKPKEVFDLGLHLTNKTGDVLNANCSIQIRNESYGVILNDRHNEINAGWYNFTYNTSKIGKYFCRQNCTKGDFFAASTCDFVIKGDDKMPLAVIISVIFVLAIYFLILINLFNQRAFTEHGLLKILFLMIAFWAILFPINMAVLYNDANGGPAGVTDNLETMYQVMIYLNYFITFYFVLWFIFQLIKKLRDAGSLLGGNL